MNPRAAFNTFCHTHRLGPVFEHTGKLKVLVDWCKNHVSRDRCYEGSEQEQYRQYWMLASSHSEDFTVAVQQGYDRVIEHQADVAYTLLNAADDYGMTPLHIAAAKGYRHTLEALLAKGADVRRTNTQKQYPLFCALFVPLIHEHKLVANKEAIFKTLLSKAPELIDKQDEAGNTVLHAMVARGFNELITPILREHSSMAFIKNNVCHYPIHTAILNHNLQAVTELLAINGVALLADAEERGPLHYAARYGNAEMVALCCAATDDLNAGDADGRTPLMLAEIAKNQAAIGVLRA